MPLVRRIGRSALKSLVELDAFPKTADSVTEKTTAGGTYSLLAVSLILLLTIHELYYYSSSRLVFNYSVDRDIESKLEINVDITIASPCEAIGADVIDPTNQNNGYAYGELKEEPVSFELTGSEKKRWQEYGMMNGFRRSEYHILHDFLWSRARTFSFRSENSVHSNQGSDACRVHGKLIANKVGGNFHVKTGKHVPLPIGHVHISLFNPFGGSSPANFSHRIEKFHFGKDISAIVNPLEGSEKVDVTGRMLYQYFIRVIPTSVNTKDLKAITYQYSVTQADREIDHHSGSHGTPGIFFKYDIEAISVDVVEEEYPLSHLIIRIIGMIAGIHTISSTLTNLSNAIVDIISCQYMERVRAGGSIIPGSGFHTLPSS